MIYSHTSELFHFIHSEMGNVHPLDRINLFPIKSSQQSRLLHRNVLFCISLFIFTFYGNYFQGMKIVDHIDDSAIEMVAGRTKIGTKLESLYISKRIVRAAYTNNQSGVAALPAVLMVLIRFFSRGREKFICF